MITPGSGAGPRSGQGTHTGRTTGRSACRRPAGTGVGTGARAARAEAGGKRAGGGAGPRARGAPLEGRNRRGAGPRGPAVRRRREAPKKVFPNRVTIRPPACLHSESRAGCTRFRTARSLWGRRSGAAVSKGTHHAAHGGQERLPAGRAARRETGESGTRRRGRDRWGPVPSPTATPGAATGSARPAGPAQRNAGSRSVGSPRGLRQWGVTSTPHASRECHARQCRFRAP